MRYQEIRDKFCRSIKSKAYESYKHERVSEVEETGLPPVNVLKLQEANELQAKLVRQSSPLLRDDMLIEKVQKIVQTERMRGRRSSNNSDLHKTNSSQASLERLPFANLQDPR